MISFRKMDVANEPLRNCHLCDKVSDVLTTSDMYELQSLDFEANSVSEPPKLYLCRDCIVKMVQVNRSINTDEDRKSFIISVSADNKGIEFCAPNTISVTPVISFTIGDDPMSLESNIPNIINHIKNMINVEGFNKIICFYNELSIYHELIAGLKTIRGIVVSIL